VADSPHPCDIRGGISGDRVLVPGSVVGVNVRISESHRIGDLAPLIRDSLASRADSGVVGGIVPVDEHSEPLLCLTDEAESVSTIAIPEIYGALGEGLDGEGHVRVTTRGRVDRKRLGHPECVDRFVHCSVDTSAHGAVVMAGRDWGEGACEAGDELVVSSNGRRSKVPQVADAGESRESRREGGSPGVDEANQCH